MIATTLVLEGRAASGLGEGRYFTSLEWAAREFKEKLGFIPYPGTFNLSLDGAAWHLAKASLDAAAGVGIDPPTGFCAAKCFEVVIEDCVKGAVVFPEVATYPVGKMEILAPVEIRSTLGLRDGDRVRLRIKT